MVVSGAVVGGRERVGAPARPSCRQSRCSAGVEGPRGRLDARACGPPSRPCRFEHGGLAGRRRGDLEGGANP